MSTNRLTAEEIDHLLAHPELAVHLYPEERAELDAAKRARATIGVPLAGRDLHKRDRVLTPDGRVVEVTWKKGEVIQVAGGQMYLAHELVRAS